MQMAVVAGARQAEGFPGKDEAGDHEEDVHHGPAGEDDADKGELDGRRGSRFGGVDAVVGEVGGHEVGVVVQEDDERGDAAEAVEVRRRVGSRRGVEVGCEAAGDWVRQERRCESPDEPARSALRRCAGDAMLARQWECRARLCSQQPFCQLQVVAG